MTFSAFLCISKEWIGECIAAERQRKTDNLRCFRRYWMKCTPVICSFFNGNRVWYSTWYCTLIAQDNADDIYYHALKYCCASLHVGYSRKLMENERYFASIHIIVIMYFIQLVSIECYLDANLLLVLCFHFVCAIDLFPSNAASSCSVFCSFSFWCMCVFDLTFVLFSFYASCSRFVSIECWFDLAFGFRCDLPRRCS